MLKKENHERNQHGLRLRLFDAMDALRNGDIEYQDAAAFAKLAAQIINSDRVEIEIHNQRMLDAKPVGQRPLAISDNKDGDQ